MDKLLDDMMKTPPRTRRAAFVALVVGLFAAYYSLVYEDQQTRLEAAAAGAERLAADVIEKQGVTVNLDRYKSEVKRLEAELDRAKSLLPDESEVPALLAQISSLGARAGLEISRFEPQAEEQKDFYARLPFKLKVTGNYHDIAAFIDSVGRLERIVNVENIGMRDPQMVSKKYMVATDFLVTTFRFVDSGAGKEQKR